MAIGARLTAAHEKEAGKGMPSLRAADLPCVIDPPFYATLY
jgi:hypothetical protein